jgi:DNA-binding NtrC family response regulator
MPSRIMVVDDEPGILEVCLDTLSMLPDVEVDVENQCFCAEKKLATVPYDLLVTDIRMPGMNGIELLRKVREKNPGLIVLMLTAFPSVETAVESMKLGAADYLTKPFRPDELRQTVCRLLEEKRLREENHLLRRQVERDYRMGEMIGKSPAIRSVFDTINQIGPTDIDVLILGETGTGKELVARNIHRKSQRNDQRFVPIDCGSIPEDLLESELFGHERGAFTGANERSIGLLEFANKGTFFLDEVGHLPLKLQAKLLRVLQERKIRRLGGMHEIDVDIRLIAATSLNLDEEIKQNRFRMDLYYRINVGRIDVPPLRERVEDIALLTSHFLNQFASHMNREYTEIEFEPEVFEVFNFYHWPGNVRELQNIVKRTLAMSRSELITVHDLPDEIVVAAGNRPTSEQTGFFKLRDQYIASFERQHLTELLKATGGDVSMAAEQAQIPRGTFYRLMKKNNLDPEYFRN